MFNYLMRIEYDGTKFNGWQFQKNGVSVQEKIEKAISKILKTRVKIVGSGRTDKGVHALAQCANFKIKKKILDEKKFLNSVNYFLNKNLITIIKLDKKNLNFHSRFSAKERTYEYVIINRNGNLSIDINKAWHVKKKMNMNLLKKGAKILEGKHDFSTYRASSCSSKSPIKRINSILVKKKGNKISLVFKSKSFLQNQVRSMVGCLKYLAEKKWSLIEFKRIHNSKKRSNCSPPAPAC